MKEWQIISLLTLGPLLWMGGGTWKRWMKTIALSAVAALLVGMSGIIWWRSLLVGLLLTAVNAQGYGDQTPWWRRILVFLNLPAPSLWINCQVWPVVLIAGFLITGLFWSSRRWNFVTHKVWEGLTGFLQMATIIMACLHP